MLVAENVSYQIEGKYLVKNFSFVFDKNKFIVIMGKNGAGKTTVLKMLSGGLKPQSGKITLDGKDIFSIKPGMFAKKRAMLSQNYDISFPIEVNELIMMGRYPYFRSRPTIDDVRICDETMRMLNIEELKERDYNTLSGGEARKVHLARTLAQVWQEEEPKILFLDEPIANLDLKYQFEIIKIAKERTSYNTLVVAVLHDINLANQFADEIIFMKDGEIHSIKKKNQSIGSLPLGEIFSANFKIIKEPESGEEFAVLSD